MNNRFALAPTFAAVAMAHANLRPIQHEDGAVTPLSVPSEQDGASTAGYLPPIDETSEASQTASPRLQAELDLSWDFQAQRRFRLLATREAEGTLTEGEYEELSQLDELRERTVGAPTGAEYLHDLRARKITRELIDAIKRYVDFYGYEKPTSGSAK